jgi:serine/threonine-protein kinase
VAVDTGILPARYRGAEQIGRGGMGDIFRATDSMLGRPVAIKVLASRYAGDHSIRQRFMREALAAARLSGQPHIVTIFDVGEASERPYIVMEYLGGGSLDTVLRREGAQSPDRAFTWLEEAAEAIDAAHERGVVHRDVKPANLLLDREGNLHVADFGIASAAGLDSLTLTGTVLGTAGYLSPEQARGERATPASDRYSLGVVAFELLTGKRPFEADSPTAEAAAHVNAPFPSVCATRKDLPCELDPVFAKALAKDPAQRYASCAEFVAALRHAMAEAAGATREIAAWPGPAPTTLPEPVLEPAYQRDRRPRTPWLAPFVAFLLLAAVGGALAAYFLTRGNGQATGAQKSRVTTIFRTVTSPSGHTTTVQQTVTTTANTSTPAPSGTDPHSLNDAGFAKMRAGDYAGALPLLQQAVNELKGAGPGDPYEGFANYNLGYTLLQLGQCKQAIPYLEKAMHLEPQRPEPITALARAKACK